MALTDFQIAMLCINLISSLVITYKGIFHVINSMTRHTYFPLRLAWVFMVTGAVAVLIGPLFGIFLTGPYGVLIHFGIALFLVSERRHLTGFF